MTISVIESKRLQRHFLNIYRLGIKELWSLWRDPMMLVLIGYLFTLGVYVGATAQPETLHNAPIAIVDQDDSPLSNRIISAFYPPLFSPPQRIEQYQVDPGMNAGRYTFVLSIPPGFQRDVLAGRSPDLQLNIDATRMTQALTGNGYVQKIVNDEISEFTRRYRGSDTAAVQLALRSWFNPNLDRTWFGSLREIINDVTMLAIILTGAALIRERERGTIEHLLAMPVTPTEIMVAKICSMGLVVLVVSLASLIGVVRGLLAVPIGGSLTLFVIGSALCLFSTSSLGIFIATLARNMPQFGMLMILIMIPLQMLSGATTPRESMPEVLQNLMLLAPTTHFVNLGQAILYRGAGLEVVWKPFLWLVGIGGVLFALSLSRFRKSLSRMV